jgi:hypothetical protein
MQNNNKMDYGSACCQEKICREESCRDLKEPQSPTTSHHPDDATCRICLGDAEVRFSERNDLQQLSLLSKTQNVQSPRASTTQDGKLFFTLAYRKYCSHM